MQRYVMKRFFSIILGLFALVGIVYFSYFLQKNHGIVGAGINRSFLFLMINAHIIAIVLLLYLIIRQSIKLFLERKKGIPGSVFKRNLLFAFIFFSVMPALFVFFTAGKFIATSIDAWFHARIDTGLKNGLLLHREQTKKLREEIAVLGQRLIKYFPEEQLKKKDGYFQVEKVAAEFLSSKDCFFKDYTVYLWSDNGGCVLGSLNDEIRIWRGYRKFNDRSTQSLKEVFLKNINTQIPNLFDFYGSLYWTKKIGNYFLLLVYRYPPNIRYLLIDLQNSITDYQQLRSIRNPIYLNYIFTFILITLLILFLSIWCAFYLARGLGKPVQDLLAATDRIRRGEWDIQVLCKTSDDLQALLVGFNEMTIVLRQARVQLEEKNKELFTILENIQTAVFLVNKYGRIIMNNAAALDFSRRYFHSNTLKNKKVSMFTYELRSFYFKILREMFSLEKKQEMREISLSLDGEERHLIIHTTVMNLVGYSKNNNDRGILFVLEDVTDIVKINKIKAWQEAAKQIAHEIKNPLTPIQLATQRLQRRFDTSWGNSTIFFECTHTILDQVQTIKTLVTHFSEFASMPVLNLKCENIQSVIQAVACLYEVGYPHILIQCSFIDPLPRIKIDTKKIERVFINLFDNSVRVLEKYEDPKKGKKNIQIHVKYLNHKKSIEILFSDNGPGINKEIRDKLFMPYVSAEKKNMGLGLAIVRDIITQHKGSITLLHALNGATFRIILPVCS